MAVGILLGGCGKVEIGPGGGESKEDYQVNGVPAEKYYRQFSTRRRKATPSRSVT